MREFFVRFACKYRRFTGGKSRFLQDGDDGKGIAQRAAELHKIGDGGKEYAWHISDLKVYENPSNISKFGYFDKDKQLVHPPQNFRYVNSLD